MTQPSPSTQNENVRASGECCQTAQHALTESELASDVQVLTALGNDTRYEALRLIADADADGGVCVCELEPALGVSQSAVSQALSRLYAAGLVSRRKDGRWRYYAVTPRAMTLLNTLDETRGEPDE
ncbi:ArsR/SmtB family transcription factor [Salinigranum halophilum]|jgi:ArsR family transcriptional regulator|uniref:ArsR/SmtB family transcription factor n=1 Tax=Salinigranum halophilum TaxID=2565931 RepID=UPI0010A79708|nr:metalloregulator ArsR/SmtB family transcription factor [Salinigranum halophilum]